MLHLSRRGLASIFCVLFACAPASAQDQPNIAELLAMALGGSPEAQTDLAGRYFRGDGVEKNDVTALEWYQRAADQGDAVGQYGVGVFHRRGIGTEVDAQTCYQSIRAAAAQGLEAAENAMAVLYYSGDCLAETNSDARAAETVKWARLAIENGHEFSNLILGFTLINAPGLALSPTEAEQAYLRADALGLEDAKSGLAYIYGSGVGGPRNIETAAQYHSELARAGVDRSVRWLGQNGFDLNGGAMQTGPSKADLYATALAGLSRSRQAYLGVVEAMTPLAEQGDRQATLYLLEALLKGAQVVPDWRAQMSYWAEEAASRDIAPAMIVRSAQLSTAQPLSDADKQEIRDLLTRAFEIADPAHQLEIETLARDALGEDPADWGRSLEWYLERADDSPHVQRRLSRMYAQRDRMGLNAPTQNLALANCWLARALVTDARLPFQSGNWEAGFANTGLREFPEPNAEITRACAAPNRMTPAQMIERAIAIRSGEIVPESPFAPIQIGASWLRLAAFQGDREAQFRLARFLDERGSKSDSLFWLRQAAVQGHPAAQLELARWLIFNASAHEGAERQIKNAEALAFLNMAATQGHELAYRELSRVYREDEIIAPDEDVARLWEDRADTAGVPDGSEYNQLMSKTDTGMNP